MKYFTFILCILFSVRSIRSYAQNCSSLNIQLQSDIPSTCNFMAMTMIHDERGSTPFLYVANKEGGLKIYNISNLTLPVLSAAVPISSVASLDVMNVSQNGMYLYLALGNSFTNPQQCGMAIIDITIPTSPLVKGIYLVPGSNTGGGIVKVEGNYAYLGAMGSGLVILDITNKSNIIFVSKYKPDINWPVNNPNSNLYNARGMEVKNSIVYLCFDAGGLRIINCNNKSAPIETGRFVNPKLYLPMNLPRAYNNIVLDDSLAYIAVDYCGLEVLNISDTSNIKLRGWWNPYNCPNNNWFTSPVHSNEIVYNKQCKYAFISTGKSDLMVINLANPAAPDSCNFYGGVNNNIGTWGVGTYNNQIYLSYVCSVIPFSSNWTGVKILTYSPCVNGINKSYNPDDIVISPNPFSSKIQVSLTTDYANSEISIHDNLGKCLFTFHAASLKESINSSMLSPGIYYVTIESDHLSHRQKLVKY